MAPAELVRRLDEWPFVPDTTALLGPYVRSLV
jgi:hypothetical protein